MSDHGGVHSNSAVPSLAYALLVDGGNLRKANSTTVWRFEGIGVEKALNIYVRALGDHTAYTTFAMHVDLVTQACTELLGEELRHPLTNATLNTTITLNDCLTIIEIFESLGMKQPLCVNASSNPNILVDVLSGTNSTSVG